MDGGLGRISSCRATIRMALLLFGLLLSIPAATSAPQVTGSGPSAITVCDPSPITYTLTITNPSGSSANNLAASVTLPSGFSYAGATSITYPSPTNPKVASSQHPEGSNVLLWDLSSIIRSGKSVLINEIHPNPAGTASQQVEIFNSGITAVDLSGWSLRRSTGTVIARIPENVTAGSLPLAPGAFLLVKVTGLNSNADDVLLFDSSGTQIDRIAYTSGSTNQGKSYASQPDGARAASSFAWRTSTLGATNGGTRGDLNVGETITMSFTLKAGCSAQDGQNLNADVAYTGGTASFTTPSTFLVSRGLLKVLKTPSVVTAGVDDVIEFEIAVENIGTGTAYNAILTNSLGSGLSQLSANPVPDTSLPPEYTWELGAIAVGEKKTVKVTEKITKCTDLFEEARANWGCSGDLCQQNYAKASVKILLKMPAFDFTLPSSLAIPYCGKALVTIPYSNSGLGKAKNVYFHIQGLPTQYEIVDVTGGSYDPGTSFLSIGDVPAQYSGEIAFNLQMKQGACDAPGSGVLSFEPNYYDECDKEWAPPTKIFSFALDGTGKPSIAVTKDGPDSLYLDQSG